VPLVNIARCSRLRPDADLRKDSGIKTPAALQGQDLGVWFGGNE